MNRSLIALLVVAACALIAAWFFTTHERFTRTEFTGYRGEARLNDFLAAELLLNELGIESDSLSSLTPSDWLPETSDTLIAPLSATFSIGMERALLNDWVMNGGHLVLLPPRQESRIADEFLEGFGIALVAVGDAADQPLEDEDTIDTYAYSLDTEHTLRRIELADDEIPAVTLFDSRGVLAARREWNSGYLTVIADSRFFANPTIGDDDHARLLLDVVDGYLEPGKVWFVYDAAFPALWQVIWSSAPLVVTSLALALALWLWSIVPRFGPAIRPVPVPRRSIIEHVRAAGQFMWRMKGAAALATSSAAAVMHEAESRHPGIGRLPARDQAQHIARMTGLPAQTIFEVLTDHDERRQREFTHNMHLLQRIRNDL